MLKQNEYWDMAGTMSARGSWSEQRDKYIEFDRYFYGDVFDDVIQQTTTDDSEAPTLLYPLKINLVKMMVMTHTQMMMGQWEERVLDFQVKQKKRGPRLDLWAENAKALITDVWDENDQNGLLMEGILACMLYGGTVYKVVSDYHLYNRVRIDHILPRYFLPRYHPFDPKRMMEVYIEVEMDIVDAMLAYNYKPKNQPAQGDTVYYREHWTEEHYEVTVGGNNDNAEEGVQVLHQGANPYGFVPFIYIPRIRPPGEFYGLAVCEDIMGIQDETNMRMADIGDRINYSSHPIWIVKNFYGDESELVLAPDEIINLGASLGGMDPSFEMVAPAGEPPSTFKYLNMCLDLAKRGAMSPPIAFGEDQGSQRSALTLEFRMWPLIQQAKWARANWTSALERLHDMIMRIRVTKDALEKRGEDDTIKPAALKHRVLPKWQPVLPRDRKEEVEEVLEAWSRGEMPTISLEAAVGILAFTEDSDEEIKRIMKLMEDRRQQEIEVQEAAAIAKQQNQEQSRPKSESKPAKKSESK